LISYLFQREQSRIAGKYDRKSDVLNEETTTIEREAGNGEVEALVQRGNIFPDNKQRVSDTSAITIGRNARKDLFMST
jgi:hypothetical protein